MQKNHKRPNSAIKKRQRRDASAAAMAKLQHQLDHTLIGRPLRHRKP